MIHSGRFGDRERHARAGAEAECEQGVRERVPGAVELPIRVDVVLEAQRDLLRMTVSRILQEVVQRTFGIVQRRATEHGLLEALDQT